jgi:hypothetical protein
MSENSSPQLTGAASPQLWLRRRFGRFWTTHVLTNIGLAWALVALTGYLGPRWCFWIALPAACFATGNTGAVYGIRRDAERLGIDLDEVNDEI